jgi:hypothetical protein
MRFATCFLVRSAAALLTSDTFASDDQLIGDCHRIRL